MPPRPSQQALRTVTAPPANPAALTKNRLIGSLGLVAASLCFAALVLEIALRVLEPLGLSIAGAIGRRDPYAVLIEPHGELGYRQRANAVLHYQNGTRATANAESYRGPIVARTKPPGTFRVILLGESTTHGWGVNDDETIDAYLREILRTAPATAGRTVEVVNLAYDGYDSYQLYERLKSDGIPREPDLIIVNAGINEVRSATLPGLVERDPRTLIWEAELSRLRSERARRGPTLWVRAKHWSYVARLPSVLRQRSGTAGAPTPVAARPAYPEAVTIFERHLERIDSLASAHGVPVFFSTPPSALLLPGAPPLGRRTYYLDTPEETQAYRDLLDERMRSLTERLGAKGRDVAYIPHRMTADLFLDDCHLTPAGNRRMAETFAAAILPMVRRPSVAERVE